MEAASQSVQALLPAQHPGGGTEPKVFSILEYEIIVKQLIPKMHHS